MATTTWSTGSGDWTDASNWRDGAPTAADDAAFSIDADVPLDDNYQPVFTVSGDGPAASLVILSSVTNTLSLTGTNSVGTFRQTGATVELAATGSLTLTARGGLGSGSLALTTRWTSSAH